MRGAEVFLALPWIYLLLGVRAFLPLHVPAGHAFLLLVALIGLVHWAWPARLVRGVVRALGSATSSSLPGGSEPVTPT